MPRNSLSDLTRRDMTPEEQAALWAQGQQGMQQQVLPMSLSNLLETAGDYLLEELLDPKLLMFLPFLGTMKNAAGKTVPGTLNEKGKYIPAPKSIEREADKLSHLPRERALREAEAKLRWQEHDKAALEAEYGQLRPAPANAPKKRKLQNTPAVVEKRIENSLAALAQPAERWQPVDYGIFPRHQIRDAMDGFPDVEQTAYPRREPTRADLSHVDETYLDPVNRLIIMESIKRGLPQGGDTFYPSLWPLKVAALEDGITVPQFNQWVDNVSTGSIRNSLPNENAVGNFLRKLHFSGRRLTEKEVLRGKEEFRRMYGMSLPLFEGHYKKAAGVLEDGVDFHDLLMRDATDSYKVPTYSTSKRGNFRHNYVGDVHEARGGSLGSLFHPYFAEQEGFDVNEYGRVEGYMRDLTRGMGLPTGTGQAGRWFGAGKLTQLKSGMGDYLDGIEKQAAYTLHEQGRSTEPAAVRRFILDLIRHGGDILPWFTDDPMPDHRMRTPGSMRTR